MALTTTAALPVGLRAAWYTCTPSCDDDNAVIIVVIVAVLLLGGIGLSVGIYCCCKQQKSQSVNVQVNAAVQAKQVAVAPAGPTVAAAPAQVVAPAFDPPLAGGGQFCTSCGQVPTPCLLVRSTLVGVGVRLPARRAPRAQPKPPGAKFCAVRPRPTPVPLPSSPPGQHGGHRRAGRIVTDEGVPTCRAVVLHPMLGAKRREFIKLVLHYFRK